MQEIKDNMPKPQKLHDEWDAGDSMHKYNIEKWPINCVDDGLENEDKDHLQEEHHNEWTMMSKMKMKMMNIFKKKMITKDFACCSGK